MTWLTDWVLARYLQRRCQRREPAWLVQRCSDGTLWAPGAPQALAYAMRGLMGRRSGGFHFYRVRIWRGLPIASRRVIWLTESTHDFDLVERCARFDLPPWPLLTECAKIEAHQASAPAIASGPPFARLQLVAGTSFAVGA